MFFETKNLIVDMFTEKDAQKFFIICNQPHILKWMPDWEMSIFDTTELIKYFINGYMINDPSKHPFALAIRLKTTNELIGLCGFGTKTELAGEVEVCYFINYSHTSKGLLNEILTPTINLYFDLSKQDFISALVDENNIVSKKLLLNNGFIYYPVIEQTDISVPYYRKHKTI